MSILPKNEPIKPDLSPHNFFIWGDTMSGKSDRNNVNSSKE
nr:MAG TPA: Helicase HerA, central domain [Caudoviricetes sp.]